MGPEKASKSAVVQVADSHGIHAFGVWEAQHLGVEAQLGLA